MSGFSAFRRIFPAITLALALSACSVLSAVAGTPPQAPAGVLVGARVAIDFAANSFDAALYGLDFAMDSGKLVPGSPTAKNLAALGRKVLHFIDAAEAARKAGNAASYEQAFTNANEALKQFRAALGKSPTAIGDVPPMTPRERGAVLDRLAA